MTPDLQRGWILLRYPLVLDCLWFGYVVTVPRTPQLDIYYGHDYSPLPDYGDHIRVVDIDGTLFPNCIDPLDLW